MSEYAVMLVFGAADDSQATRIAEAISSLCCAEFSTRPTAVVLDADHAADLIARTRPDWLEVIR